MKRLLLIVVASIAGIAAAAAQVTLAFNPDKGATYLYTMEMDQNILQKLMGQEIPMGQKLTTLYNMDVIDKTHDQIHLRFTYRDFYYELANSMMSIKYDSREPEDSTATASDMGISQIYKSMIGKELDVVMGTDGTVHTVTGMEAIIEGMQESVSGNAAGSSFVDAMKLSYNDEAMRSTFEQQFKMYPAEPVREGESWQATQDVNAGGLGMSIASTYTLRFVDKGIAMVDVVSKISTPDSTLAGTQQGQFSIDVRTGLQNHTRLEQEMKGNFSTQGVDVEMEMNSHIFSTTEKRD